MGEKGFACPIVLLVISLVFYVIAMGVGWGFDQMAPPVAGTIPVRAGAIVSTIPVFAVVVLIFLACLLGLDNVNAIATSCAIGIVLFAGVFEFVGGILFIVAGVQAGDPRALAFGVSAGVFSLLAGVTYCGTIATCKCVCDSKKGAQPENGGE